jgi:hypothetical protein
VPGLRPSPTFALRASAGLGGRPCFAEGERPGLHAESTPIGPLATLERCDPRGVTLCAFPIPNPESRTGSVLPPAAHRQPERA